MSERDQALMRTRCPECGTIFRVTSEQLRRKAGKVRCGHCQAVFNAFDQWQSDNDETLVTAPVEESFAQQSPEENGEPEMPFVSLSGEPEPEPEPESFNSSETLPVSRDFEWEEQPDPPVVAPEAEVDAEPEAVLDEATMPPLGIREDTDIPEIVRFDAAETLVASPADRWGAEENRAETLEQSTLAAREAGLVAARELVESSSYNRWAAGTLASDGRGVFDVESPKRTNWPFVLVSALLLIALVVQVLHYYRTEIVLRIPSVQPMYGLFGVTIPLPRNSGLVSIETSDLQSDNARGLFVLQATLKNRAIYPQAWPALELSLTDTNDAVVARRVMYAAEYLPPGTTADTFPPNGDVAIRLWIEAKDVGASGYRLYIFYP
ncbi:MAG: zinc-ribbon domain-containing protein [Betaproteobacteria bacterium]|nr:zinc-ribbon domain-containing protein [Betaproteobacteria bacterium]